MGLPRAQTACSHTLVCGDPRSLRKRGTAFASTTAWVWRDVPDAMLVNAQAASNWNTNTACNACDKYHVMLPWIGCGSCFQLCCYFNEQLYTHMQLWCCWVKKRLMLRILVKSGPFRANKVWRYLKCKGKLFSQTSLLGFPSFTQFVEFGIR